METTKKSAVSKVTTAGLLVALGIIYGDIGTSPLYVLKAIVGTRPVTEILVYGGVSCVFWTLVFQTTVKYIWLTLQADNHGEGGIFSLYALVNKYGKKLVIPTILGATTLLADGIITPPISVASAIEGLQIVVPGLQTVPIIIVILSVLFFAQRYGTQKIGSAFGPVMFIWFAMIFVMGAMEITHYPDVLKALSPYYAYVLLTQYPQGFWLLGAVFLCTTGAEALYSDLGHCGKKNIRITWTYVKICLVTSYVGQAAWIMHDGGSFLNGRNPFFEMMPHWFLITGIIIATLATIIASQALITGSYTLINEAMNLNFWPRIAVHQPTKHKGQIYIPSVNNILWFGCILMILYFKSSTHMEAAYGFSITIAMLMTSLLLCYYLRYKKQVAWGWIILFMVVFGSIETSFFITNVAKIKERWMFLFFELFIFLTMYTWYYARKVNNRFTKFVEIKPYASLIKELRNDENIPLETSHLVYLTKANNPQEIEEKLMNSILSNRPKRAYYYWFLHINRVEEPYELTWSTLELADHMIKINVNVGFRVQMRSELYFKRIIRELTANKEFGLDAETNKICKYTNEHNFKFVVIEKYLSIENEFSFRDGILLKSYFFLKRLGLSDRSAFGLDKSDVLVEQIPLIYKQVKVDNMQREEYEVHENLVF
jgi:KUP system potassium uptake protein